MPSDFPQRQCGILNREGGTVFGQILEVIAFSGAPVLPRIGAAGDFCFEDIAEVGRALVLIKERRQQE